MKPKLNQRMRRIAQGSGIYPRAKATHEGGARIRYTWPCGHYRIEVWQIGPRGHKQRASPEVTRFMAHYWSDGVSAGPCPTCKGKTTRRNS